MFEILVMKIVLFNNNQILVIIEIDWIIDMTNLKIGVLVELSKENHVSNSKSGVPVRKIFGTIICCKIFKLFLDDSSVMTLAGHRVTTTLIRARFSPQYTGSRYVYSGDSNYGYCVWDLFTGQLIVKNDFFHRMNVRDCSWHPHRPLIATSR